MFFFAIAVSAEAAPLSSADRSALEGVWRLNANTSSDPCGRDGNFEYGVEITFEFKLTGGEIYFEDRAEGSGGDRIVSASRNGDVIAIELADRHPAWKIRLAGSDKAEFDGRLFTRCTTAEPRTAIHLDKADVDYLATGLVPSGVQPFYGAYFVDGRNPRGCKAEAWEVLAFDLRNPARPSLQRFQNVVLKHDMAKRSRPRFNIETDGEGGWAINGAARGADGWQFKGPNSFHPMARAAMRHHRGETHEERHRNPAWKRSYTRCVFG